MNDPTEFDLPSLEALARSIEEVMDPENPEAYLGPDLAGLAGRIPAEAQVTPGAVVRLALLNDALCIVERAVRVDGRITDLELNYARPLVREAVKYLSRFRNVYRESFDLERQDVGAFIEHHMRDGQKFGGRCRSTAWVGLSVCQRTAAVAREPMFVEQFRELMVRTLDDLFDLVGSGTAAEKQAIVNEIERLAPASKPDIDPREAAYCSTSAPEVFHTVAHAAEVFELDPFDIDTVHAEARETFARLVDRSSDAKYGRMLLVKGDAGSGKTHLMRAFRNQVHGEGLGFVGYLQMTTATSNYGRYLLSNVIDSWDRPYWGEATPSTGLACLSEAVANDLPGEILGRLSDEALPSGELDALVNHSADQLVALKQYASIHIDLLRVMLYLKASDPPRRARLLKFLRCEELSPYDRQFLGGVAPYQGEEGPIRMLVDLGRLVAATKNGSIVLLVDQLEDIFHLDQAPVHFRLAMDALRQVTDRVPTAVVVVACLNDFYTSLRSSLAGPMLDRLERDPEPVQLTVSRTAAEVEQIVARRLEHLFDVQRVRMRAEEPLFPFRREQLFALANLRTRDVLDWCRRHREASIRAGRISEPAGSQQPADPIVDSGELAQAWNDHRAKAPPPIEAESERMRLFAWALEQSALELDPEPSVHATAADNYVDAALGSAKVCICLCDKKAQGGHLGKQVDALAQRAKQRAAIPLVLRSSEYPPPGTTQVAQKLKELLQQGGRKLTLTDTEWRLIQALQTFRNAQGNRAEFGSWLKKEKPLNGIPSLRVVAEFGDPPRDQASLESVRGAAPPTAHAKAEPELSHSHTAATSTLQPHADFGIGQTRGLTPHTVLVSPRSFTTHAAFLGSTQSGKTTLALSIIEHLLTQGVPVLMLDRKGDLATYGWPEFWETEPADDHACVRKRALRQALDVCVFTPGEPRGRPLALSVIPSGLDDGAAHERGMLARYAAAALGAMMGYRKSKSDETRLGILGKAIELVGRARSTQPLGIAQLVAALDDEDPDLVSAVGKLDTKHFHALVENLETLRLRYEHLLRHEGEQLSPELLFGIGDKKTAGRTRLSVISTKFIGDNAAVDFWVARLLAELSRWASRRPADSLQAVVFLDEADIYLPAQSKPATKEPMLDLLKRARSAGLGVFLATQSPGDLDYRCRDNIRTWFVGRVAEKTAVDKMRPLLNDCRVNVAGKLAQAKTGEFWKLEDGDALEFKATPSIMKTSQLSEDAILRASRGGDPR